MTDMSSFVLAYYIFLVHVSILGVILSIELPLHTESRWIVDKGGNRVKLACVNWYGAEEKDYVVSGLHVQSIDNISSIIQKYGFNCVRLPFSNEMVEKNPVITNSTVIKANMNLYGKTALEVFDEVVMSLQNHKLMVILDNHNSDANWCCSESDENGLWYNSRYTEEDWINDWTQMIQRYKSFPYVVGVDLRNELRKSCFSSNNDCISPCWGCGNPKSDWKQAAEKLGNLILSSLNPNLLIIIEGLSFALDLTGVYSDPITSLQNQLVYESHDYSWSQVAVDCHQLHTILGDRWGYILTEGQKYTAPVWVGEFGTCHTSESCIDGGGKWFSCFLEYLKEADIDWSYWAIDGTEARGGGRVFGSEETFGILNMMWDGVAMEELLNDLQKIQNKTQGP